MPRVLRRLLDLLRRSLSPCCTTMYSGGGGEDVEPLNIDDGAAIFEYSMTAFGFGVARIFWRGQTPRVIAA